MSETHGHDLAESGDPACWLDRVCDACGAMREDMAAPRCARCGAPFPGAPSDHPEPAPPGPAAGADG
jgi:predicted amidophosphoribosyltransferase